MKLTILGSGTCIPTAERNAAGYVISVDNQHLLFDSGPGTIRRLTEAGFDFREIDHLFYSHLHLDHVADLFPLLFSNKNAFRETARRPIHLYGPQGFENFYSAIARALGSQIISENYPIFLRELMPETLDFPDWKISTCLVPHTDYSLACRLDTPDGASLVYSGDTDFSDELIQLARGCRVLLLECSFPENQKVAGHLIPSEAAKIAAAAECEKLVLTHFYPPVNETAILATAEKYFTGEIIIAEDLAQILI
jgi:ribonuclease BN (tRNA processing enzyme)